MAEDETNWEDAFRRRWAEYDLFRRRIDELICSVLATAGIDVIQVESRTKSVDSFAEKIRRKADTYTAPLDDITDLVGVRIITYYVEDVARVCELLRTEFDVDDDKSVDKTALLEADEFGYQSVHLVVKLVAKRLDLAEWKQYSEYVVEIQVRTALQHAWAAVSHKLDYKSTADAPTRLRRRLFRLSALFELADDQLSQLRNESEATTQQYRRDVQRGSLDVPLDASSLQVYWNLVDAGRAADIAESAGTPIAREPDDDVDKDRFDRDRRDLLTTLRHFKMTRLQDLHDFLAGHERLLQLLRLAKWNEHEDKKTIDDALTLALMLDRGASEALFKKIYSESYWPDFAKKLASVDR